MYHLQQIPQLPFLQHVTFQLGFQYPCTTEATLTVISSFLSKAKYQDPFLIIFFFTSSFVLDMNQHFSLYLNFILVHI